MKQHQQSRINRACFHKSTKSYCHQQETHVNTCNLCARCCCSTWRGRLVCDKWMDNICYTRTFCSLLLIANARRHKPWQTSRQISFFPPSLSIFSFILSFCSRGKQEQRPCGQKNHIIYVGLHALCVCVHDRKQKQAFCSLITFQLSVPKQNFESINVQAPWNVLMKKYKVSLLQPCFSIGSVSHVETSDGATSFMIYCFNSASCYRTVAFI